MQPAADVDAGADEQREGNDGQAEHHADVAALARAEAANDDGRGRASANAPRKRLRATDRHGAGVAGMC